MSEAFDTLLAECLADMHVILGEEMLKSVKRQDIKINFWDK